VRLCAAFLIFCSVLSAQVIEGTVVDSVTGAAISGASVEIENAGKAPYRATSNAQGAFRIEGVADGTYTALAFKDGFLTVRDEAARKPFHVVGGLDPVQLKLILTPRSRLSGHVLDGNGRPVAGAGILLRQGGGAISSGATSDAEGNYSFDVRPGAYFLSARAPLKLTPPAPVGDQHYAWAKTWFPGVTDLTAAQKILIRPGAELVDQDIKLIAEKAYAIRGYLRDSNGDPAPQLAITLTRSDDSQALQRTALSAKDGSFEFGDVYDGDWRLSARSDAEVVSQASANITMNGQDVEGLDIRLRAPFAVPVEFILQASDSSSRISGGNVLLAPEPGGPSPSSVTDVNGDSHVGNVYPGRYLVKALPLAGKAYYLASITLGDRDVLGQMVEINSGSVPVKLFYRSDGGAIRGTVEDCGNATIAIAPEDPALQRADMASTPIAHCTSGNRFEIHNLRPGRYYAFAFDQFEMNRAEFVSSLPALMNKAVTVEVKASETTNVDLKVTVVAVP
jgi:Carboxypeptidase regulatory-like domain